MRSERLGRPRWAVRQWKRTALPGTKSPVAQESREGSSPYPAWRPCCPAELATVPALSSNPSRCEPGATASPPTVWSISISEIQQV